MKNRPDREKSSVILKSATQD